ncbi:hypothetical protein ESCO_005758 [Escovopsis weberi]|uniref:Uncharacterized protein n=1 Tax=Escovopsis weberi TaxID=150374 RepID=A0A0M9VUM0_ESCWE|nr:hypothetical protein ESCO_005758 [Escovopsis weberi]
MYHHMNNSVYSFMFDSVINDFLVNKAGLHPPSSAEYAIIAHTETTFVSSIAYPAVAEVGVRVTHLGRSSVTYEVALFEKDVPGVKAVGGVVHVFVDRASGKPVRGGMGAGVRAALEEINLGPVGEKSKL